MVKNAFWQPSWPPSWILSKFSVQFLADLNSTSPKSYISTPRSPFYDNYNEKYGGKCIFAAILAAIWSAILDFEKSSIFSSQFSADLDTTHPKIYISTPKSPFYHNYNGRYDQKCILEAILAAILYFTPFGIFSSYGLHLK